ncbi:MAG: hypothetical protein KTR22_08770 [Flavobacteriaceae bacterium]|nr:hypothetical protein [Flavobacteriaceae bacterium]
MKIKDKKEILLLQYQEGVITFRNQVSLVVQIMTVMIIGNITIAGFAFDNKSSILLILGSFFPITILVLVYFAKKLMRPFIENSIKIERLFTEKEDPRMIKEFIEKTQSKNSIRNLDKITFTNRILSKSLFIGLAIGQISLGTFLHFYYNWQLF